ncbi:unnamed protein product [Caenorhabditis bovis]|uniref:Serpentine Receptor, class H n=1 Tax=Caenorhabditis bovis TaxID=2654633 RepID=A0A8S1ET49_9PELO|nr:unnamed protein product [Caenorhabditis bovis]
MLILMYKCPRYFQKYRILLILHVFGNFSFDLFMSFFWNPIFILPYMIACTTGIAWQYPFEMFLLFIINIIYTGIVILHMFEYRMKASLAPCQNGPKLVEISQILIKIGCVLAILLVLYCRDIFANSAINQKFNGTPPVEAFCPQCILLVDFNFIPCAFLFFLSSMLVAHASLLIVYCALNCYASLQKLKSRVSPRTHELQRQFLRGLLIQMSVHFALLGLPTMLLVVATWHQFVYSNWTHLIHFFTILISAQGGISTTVMLISTKPLLRNLLQKLKRNTSTTSDLVIINVS